MDEPTQSVSFEERGNIDVGTILSTDMLDGMNVTHFGEEVLNHIGTKPGLHLLLNFEKVTYMSSAALTELLKINESVRLTKGSVRLCSLSTDIRQVFEITNLEKLFVIHEDDSLDAAIQRFERSLAVAADEEAWSSPDSPG